MPRVNIYIRDDDWAKWEAIPSVPDWLHAHLNEDDAVPHLLSTVDTKAKDEITYENMEDTP